MAKKALETARKAGQIALGKRGFDIKILKMDKISSICDYFVIVSGDVDVHVKAISNAIVDELQSEGIKPFHKEGLESGNWVLLDYVDVVIHIFREPVRMFYALEKLWGDAPIEVLKDE